MYIYLDDSLYSKTSNYIVDRISFFEKISKRDYIICLILRKRKEKREQKKKNRLFPSQVLWMRKGVKFHDDMKKGLRIYQK